MNKQNINKVKRKMMIIKNQNYYKLLVAITILKFLKFLQTEYRNIFFLIIFVKIP
jgi:hypothetical protein